MPVNLDLPPPIAVPGVALATTAAGIKANGKTDLVLMTLAPGSAVAGVFTRNLFAAAPVTVAKRHLESTQGAVRALLVNSGNANAGTGAAGIDMASGHCDAVALSLDVASDAVLPFSTGVIGVPLPDAVIRTGIAALSEALPHDAATTDVNATQENWLAAARGIMTTDTQPKITSQQIEIDGQSVTVTGFAKGAGMIEPNMATMLSYVFSDAAVDVADLQNLLRTAVADSFNAITVDSDTSTNDACLLCATGQGPRLSLDSAGWSAFSVAVSQVCLDLAQAIIRDAEGATKFITVDVTGGKTRDECRDVAYRIANSPLVKTAMFASDANVGRLLMAIGKADLDAFDAAAVKVSLGDLLVFEKGLMAAGYDEESGAAVLAKDEIVVRVELGRGTSAASVYTSDLSHEYVTINAEYRT